jgi:hypothetical protein
MADGPPLFSSSYHDLECPILAFFGEIWGHSPFFILRGEGKVILLGVAYAVLRASCLSRNQSPQSGMFQVGNKFLRPERPSGVGVLPQGGQTAGRFSSREMLPLFCHHPALPPALHFQRPKFLVFLIPKIDNLWYWRLSGETFGC